MTTDVEKGSLDRLEDYIELAKQGKSVNVKVGLMKQFIKEKLHPNETDDMTDELDMYLLNGEFICGSAGNITTISKVYVLGSVEETAVESQVNKNIANERLKMDYQRLHEANITFEEKYF